MKLQFQISLLALLQALPRGRADNPISDAHVQADLAKTGGVELAYASRPAALINGKQNGTQPDVFPIAGTNCASPGDLKGGKGNPFPTYYVVKPCGSDEIRIIYSLYYTHDGFSNVLIAKGHEHDWERIVVIWGRDADSNTWSRKSLLKSFHTGYMSRDWSDLPATATPPALCDGKNGDSPKVFPGWAKHAMFDDIEIFWKDPASEGCSREYRDSHWWFLPEREHLIDASATSKAGIEMAKFDWGSATGSPWHSEETICAAKDGGYVWC